jgi:choline dehydrogenase-like flavoprotein
MSTGALSSERPKRALRLGEPEIHTFTTSDNFELRLTRYQGGPKGPVVVSPGFGTSTLAYVTDTVDTNFAEYLYANGYDVWLFDYRSSPALECSKRQFNVDDIATHDYPAALAKVREVSGADDVQFAPHCVGSLSFVMSLASGLEGVRSAVCSQVALHPVVAPAVRAKTSLRVATLLKLIGDDFIQTGYDPSKLTHRALDEVMEHFPTREECDSPVCHRILFFYGEVYRHAQLNEPTHAAIADMFGMANLTTFEHMTKVVNGGRAVDADGEDAYIPNAGNMAVPITFIHGDQNNFFLPTGTQQTYELLCETNGPDLYARYEIPGYAHMDCFIGANASNDVFPLIVRELDRFN